MTGPVELACQTVGDEDRPPLIILHGFFASSRNWKSVAQRFAENFHVLLVDLRNHGDSPHAAEMDYPCMAEDLMWFLTRRGYTQVHVLGHSMGGKVAMWFALNYPKSLKKLIVADISPSRYEHSFTNTIQALKALPLGEIRNRRQAEEHLADVITESDYRQFLLQNLQLIDGQYRWRVDLDIFARTADNIVSFPIGKRQLSYSGEALFLGGEHSDYIIPQDVYRFFPKAEIKMLPNAGHWLHVQQPELFCRYVTTFLESS